MSRNDVRDLRGRSRRACISIAIGAVSSFGLTLALPTRDHFPVPPGGCGFSHQEQGWLVEGGSPSLMVAGAVALALAAYAVLGTIANGLRSNSRVRRTFAMHDRWRTKREELS